MDETITIPSYSKSQVRGYAKGVKPNPNSIPNFKFKAGYSLHDDL